MTSSYQQAGVNIDAGDEFVKAIKDSAAATYRPEVLSGIGGFGAHFALNLQKYKQPVLVSSTDGVGTKLRIAIDVGRYDTIGQDLVGMCVNDIICSGAEPLFFLDYFASGHLDPSNHAAIVQGIARACGEINCSLIGGETAEMPGMYHGKDFDIAGFTVGAVERDEIIDGSSIAIDDAIIGIASSGFHSNGYSLIRAVCTEHKLNWNQSIPGVDQPLGEALLTPTCLYPNLISKLRNTTRIRGIAHITGGGITDNLPRILPKTCQGRIEWHSWELPPLMKFIQQTGNIGMNEMRRVFNCGIGLCIVVPEEDAIETRDRIQSLNQQAWIIGKIAKRPKGDPGVVYV
ncbi:MAG: phosphoribosylformylglycinamidine cyclo-ligase [Deltaproteobacteria bacterium CG11_big_fil_rev_8_21_14_0_20_47_16]|nr:MAG: phosphoribosylformylglycinamidine cyclo-ligase [Deltaproteobacteria bacterium CG11_big_fil_rev_8_21_14_0_20_47_16]